MEPPIVPPNIRPKCQCPALFCIPQLSSAFVKESKVSKNGSVKYFKPLLIEVSLAVLMLVEYPCCDSAIAESIIKNKKTTLIIFLNILTTT
ncbi:hypothetical protein DR84_1931 [Francisella tularensis]|nr:hypothetical protein DR84_1931 [Francisella tularensis]